MNKKKLPVLITLGILLVLACIISVSYALFIVTDKQPNNNILNSSCLDFEIKNEQNEISLQNSFPLLDEDGKKLTPFTFTVKNTCSSYMSYTLNLETLKGSTLHNKYIKVLLNNEAITNLDTLPSSTTEYYYEGSIASKILGNYGLGPDEEEDFTLRLWMDEDTIPNEETMNKIFNSKIVIRAVATSYDPVSAGITTLHDAILANEYQVSDVQTAINKIVNKQEVDTTKPAPMIEWQENISSDSIINVESTILPAKSLIGTSFDVTEDDTKILLGTSYVFNSETGYYDLVNYDYYDALTLNYDDNDYYYCNNSHSISADDKITIHRFFSNCTNIIKVTAVKSENLVSTNSTTGTKYDVVKYFFNGYKFNQVELESDKSDRGLYSAEDDYGTTYYYRGSVKNNYVYFANFYWQIIRINGDGSVRLIYVGRNADAFGSGSIISTSEYNLNNKNPAYVGYMYGNVLNSSSKETQANIVDSNVKKILEDWYNNNIELSGYGQYIANSGFCNDRSIFYYTGTKPGYGNDTDTYYSGYNRIYNTKQPTFKCKNLDNDLFTTSTATIGNKAAKYPIGLITADEVMYAGDAYGYINSLNYIYKGSHIATMTPSAYSSKDNTSYFLSYIPNGFLGAISPTQKIGIRPVINLKSDTKISSGIGTKNSPFIIA